MARGASGEPSSDSSSSRGDCCNNFFGSLWLKRFMCTVGLLTSLAIGFVSVFALIGAVINPLSIFFCAYQLIFAIMLILAELKLQFFMRWFLFLAPYVGLGLFYIFVAIFTVGNGKWWQILVAAICGAIGICYMFMGFAGQDRGINTDVIDKKKARDAAVTYAASKGSEYNTAENRQVFANAAMEEGRRQANPFENDNPFENQSSGRSAYS